MKRRYAIFNIALLLTAVVTFIFASGSGKELKLATLTNYAEIIYHKDGHIYSMNRNGEYVAQITFGKYRNYEHVAVSADRRFIVANEQLPNPADKPGGMSILWLYDLQEGTEIRLLPKFDTAGNGGVAWDRKGFIYFAAKEKDIVANPRTPADFIKNAGANDVYKMKFDGTMLQRLTNTSSRGEADVGVSEDDLFITYNAMVLNPSSPYTEVWMRNSDGSDPRLLYKGGAPRINSVHDPELSSDLTKVVFSRVNSTVPPNFPNNPAANTAHDLCSLNLDGSGFQRLTFPGPISIIPNINKAGLVLLTEINEREKYAGASLVSLDHTDQRPKRLRAGASAPRWIPER